MKDPLNRWTADALRNRRIPAGVRHQLIKDGRFRSRLIRRAIGDPPVVPPTPWLDPELRTFSDTGGTTPVSADAATVLGWRTVDGELINHSGLGSEFPFLTTVNGKKALSTRRTGDGMSGIVSSVSRPSNFDILYAVNAANVGLLTAGAQLANMLETTSPTTAVVLAPRYRRVTSSPTSPMSTSFGNIGLFNPALGTTVASFAVPPTGQLPGPIFSEWAWQRFTATPGSVRIRVYTGPGALVVDTSRATAQTDAVLNTGDGSTIRFYAQVMDLGRIYRKPDGLFTDEELAAIFADSNYP